MTSRIILLSISILAYTAVLAQTTNQSVTALAGWHHNFPHEKIYVQQDKPYYVLGEQVWFKVYLVNAVDHSFITPSQTVYVELLDSAGTVMDKRNIRIRNGAGNGDFLINPKWPAGRYHIHAYTAYMLNYDEAFHFIRPFNIGDIQGQRNGSKAREEQEVEVSFYPESGNLLCAIESSIAVRSLDEHGFPVAIKAKVLDNNDQLITLFATNEKGYGKFALTPLCDDAYRIELVDHPKMLAFPIPEAQPSGYSLSVKNVHKDEIYVKVAATPDLTLNDCYVVGHLRGDSPWLQDGLKDNATAFKIKSSELEGGVHHLTLFQGNGIPVSERLLYRHASPEQVEIALQGNLAQRNRQTLKISLPPSVHQ
ncbi:MAG: hypothetical protein KTR24_03445, partial [Saprospiraceae bacterium]|nr:hypothetical protein [Saprospiraceae bacterium]